jgi:hypothetical protein
MRATFYLLVEPNASGASHFPAVLAADVAAILLEPLLVSHQGGGRSSWTHDDYKLLVKLTYLARIREYTFLASAEQAIHILGSDEVSSAIFDRWWTIRFLDSEGSTDNLRDYVVPLLGKIPPTESALVNAWLASLSNA